MSWPKEEYKRRSLVDALMRIVALPVTFALSLACGDPGVGETEAEVAELGSGEAGSGTDEGPDCADHALTQPVGCEDVEFPNGATPRTDGVELLPQLDPTHGFQAVVAFHSDSSPVCGDVCPCHDVEFGIHFQSAPTAGEIHRVELGKSQQVIHVERYVGSMWHPEHQGCSYQVLDLDSETSDAQVEVHSVGESCLAGTASGFEGEFTSLNGAFMAGRCPT